MMRQQSNRLAVVSLLFALPVPLKGLSLALAALLFFSTAPLLLPAHAAVNPADLEALKQLFEKDPATAFEKSWRMFQDPMKKGDLEGMMGIIRVVGPASRSHFCVNPLDDMIDSAVPLAQNSGQWETLGHLCLERAETARMLKEDCGVLRPAALRIAHFGSLAREAFAKMGAVPQRLRYIENVITTYEEMAKWANTAAGENYELGQVGPLHWPLVKDIAQAVGEGHDREALTLVENLLRQVATEQDDRIFQAVLWRIGWLLWLRGAERIISPLRRLVDARGDRYGGSSFVNGIATGCAVAWTGRDDVYRRTFYWCFKHLDLNRHGPGWALGQFATKLRRFGEIHEANRLLRYWVELMHKTRPAQRGSGQHAQRLVWPGAPDDVRRGLVFITCSQGPDAFLEGKYEVYVANLGAHLRNMVDMAPAGQERRWAFETGLQLLGAATRFPTAEFRATGVADAAELLAQGGREDLAEQARAFSAALARGDPHALLKCALSAARSAAAEGCWLDVEKQLEPVVTGKAASRDLLQATLLLERAKRSLKKPAEADTCLVQAKSLVSQIGLSAGERVNCLMSLSRSTSDRAEKTRLLEQAKQAAESAGLAVMAESLATRLSQLALETGDLPSAKRALLDLVRQQEAKRERLAFDPLLRQQWFAENLGSYRKLLQVCAQLDDAPTALWCAERMRARALADQLSWRKVDLCVRLPKAVRQRFEKLREKRRAAYNLLRKVSGMAPVEDTALGMPAAASRGFSIPIRSLLDQEQKVTTEDEARLREMLAELAKEEAALESVIREGIPEYRLAAKAVDPSPQELLQAIPASLGVLEYTLTEAGVVAVAVGPGHGAVVKALAVTPDQLQGGVSRLRQYLIRRRGDLDQRAADWYRKLVEPFENTLRGSRQLMIIAEGVLQLLPFNTLRDSDRHYLVERYPLVYAPSLTLALSWRGQMPKAERSALIVAAPQLSKLEIEGQGMSQLTTVPEPRESGAEGEQQGEKERGYYLPIRGEEGLSSELTSMVWRPLPGAKVEGEAVAKRLGGATLLTGEEATKERLQQEAGKYNLLHLATHGYADPEVPEFSGLLFAGSGEKEYEALTAEEVYLWQLRAQLVTLSACETGLGRTVEGEGLMGLTRAFLYAGARDVVCSLWQVSDESTSQLMERFYEQWQRNPDAAKALQAAQQALLSQEKTKHPFYWAAFVVVQGPR